FTKLEFRTFITMLNKQTVSLSEINKELKMAKSNLSSYIKRIREKKVIFEGITLNLKKFNLSIYCIKVKYPLENKFEIKNIIPPSPFLRRIYYGRIGCNCVLVFYLIPDTEEALNDLRKIKDNIEKTISECNAEIYKLDRQNRLCSFNYSTYDFKKGKWNFNLEDIDYNLYYKKNKELYSESQIILEDFPETRDEKLVLDKEAVKVLEYLYSRSHYSVNKIINDTNIRENKVREIISYFESKNLLKKRINPLTIFGLSNIVVFLNLKKEEQKFLHADLSFFPELYSEPLINEDGEQSDIFLILRVPEEIAFYVLDELSKKYEKEIRDLFVVNQMYSSRKDLPLERFDTLFKKWQYSSVDVIGEDKND
ncbi:MAG: hypothetical protein ACTSQE_16230, partial [Candidatus Heimdallarchaeaceae archaeon]